MSHFVILISRHVILLCHIGVQTEKPDFNACVLCRTAQRNILFIPCGHMTVCQQCDSSVTRCSLCEAEVNEKIKVPYII